MGKENDVEKKKKSERAIKEVFRKWEDGRIVGQKAIKGIGVEFDSGTDYVECFDGFTRYFSKLGCTSGIELHIASADTKDDQRTDYLVEVWVFDNLKERIYIKDTLTLLDFISRYSGAVFAATYADVDTAGAVGKFIYEKLS